MAGYLNSDVSVNDQNMNKRTEKDLMHSQGGLSSAFLLSQHFMDCKLCVDIASTPRKDF